MLLEIISAILFAVVLVRLSKDLTAPEKETRKIKKLEISTVPVHSVEIADMSDIGEKMRDLEKRSLKFREEADALREGRASSILTHIEKEDKKLEEAERLLS